MQLHNFIMCNITKNTFIIDKIPVICFIISILLNSLLIFCSFLNSKDSLKVHCEKGKYL